MKAIFKNIGQVHKAKLETHFEQKYKFHCRFIFITSKIPPKFDKQTIRPNPIQTIDFKKIKIGLFKGDIINFETILKYLGIKN